MSALVAAAGRARGTFLPCVVRSAALLAAAWGTG